MENNEQLIKRLVKRIEALEAERLFKDTQRPVPGCVIDDLLDTAGAVGEAKRLDWVTNIGI